MRKVNARDIDEIKWDSPKGRFGEFWYQPDSKKWSVSLPKRTNIRSEPLDYFDGEE